MNRKQLLDIKLKLDKQRAPRDLKYFFKSIVWPILEPKREIVWGMHLDAIIDHLQEMFSDDPVFSKLIINLPPGFSKSLLTSVTLPVWIWLRNPEERILTASYSGTLAVRDSLKSRNIMQHDRFKTLFCSGDDAIFNLSRDQNQKSSVQNDKLGTRVAVSVGGSTTGQRAGVLILDDPIAIDDWANDSALVEAWNWYKDVWSSRRSDPITTRELIIQQRLNHNDISGKVMREVGGFEVLRLPMRYDASISRPTILGMYDTRTKKGTLLDPERFPEAYVLQEEKKLGRYSTSAQFQQMPKVGIGDDMFNYEYFTMWLDSNTKAINTEFVDIETDSGKLVRLDIVPYPTSFSEIIISIDASFGAKKTTNSMVSIQTWGIIGETFYLLDRITHRMSFTELINNTKVMKKRFPLSRRTLIESKANGPALIDTLKTTFSGLIPIHPTESKLSRAHSTLPVAESHNIVLPHINKFGWVKELLENLVIFPFGDTDDDMDAMTQVINYKLSAVRVTIS